MSAFAPAPKPENLLARYRVLSPKAAVHVSQLQLGAMSIGDKWDQFGNFIDTANNYQDQSSEEFIGEWAEKRGIRNELVIATKYTSNYVGRDGKTTQRVLFSGNNFKSMAMSVEDSLRKLRTSYIDILYVHWWDYDTSVEEVMIGLNNLIKQGKVLYLGVSDTPAWIVSKANQYARDHGLSEFIIYQGAWNVRVMSRDFERKIIPMARQERMALAPWNERSDSEDERKVASALQRISNEVGTSHVTAVAIAYVTQKTTHVFPIIGGRKIEHLQANIDALKITLTPEHIQEPESLVPFSLGFPYDFFGSDSNEYGWMMKMAAWLEKQPHAKPIAPDSD
ncbi:Aldo keto reductase [Coniophora puteana RWD-64-598 SS2]|uniref:Aldo keto reductase n=1 Tax=Coniophora puteana (strain RWD-64-598) TaxID=741705 RepID=A0A5M3MXA6_CONPW|nr:Aldo keto reductase [Coniophora puteana RWD-64-598 SS2]EIW83722.1 Aldo keto reductase [Coniophora puteana RWD-64-598 SS2]